MNKLHLKLKEKLLMREIENLEDIQHQYGSNVETSELILNTKIELAEIREEIRVSELTN